MFLTLSNIRSELKVRLKESGLGNSQIDLWANLAQDRIVTSLLPSSLRLDDTKATVVDQREYLLDVSYNQLFTVINTTSDRQLSERSEAQIENMDPDRSESGTPDFFALGEPTYVSAQPTAASVITVVSTSASDTSEKVRVRGTVSGADDTELLTLNGTTGVAGTKSFTAVHSITKDGTTVGRVSATSDAATVTIVTLAPNEQAHSYQRLILYPIPSAVETLRLRGLRYARKMVNSEDHPDLPMDLHEAVVVGATVIGHRALYNFEAANQVENRELKPMIELLKQKSSNTNRKKSPVKLSQFGSFTSSEPRLPRRDFNP